MARNRQKKRKASYPRCCGVPMKVLDRGSNGDMKCLLCGNSYNSRGVEISRR